MIRSLIISLLLCALPTFAADVTPWAYLASQPKPNFATGHNLPHLTKFSWPYSYDLNVEMATNWGYTLDLGDANATVLAEINTSNSTKWKFIQLATNYPTRYALSINTERALPTNLSAGFWVTNSSGYFVDNNTNLWRGITNTAYTKVVSPEAPDADLMNEAEFHAAPLRAIVSNAPIAIILNGGERDLGCVGFDKRAWQFDPRVLAQAVVTNAYADPGNTNGLSWPRYISNKKAHQLSFLTSAVRTAVPNRELYIFYNTGNEQNRYVIPGYGIWEEAQSYWGWDSAVMNANTDLPSLEDYYVGGTSWTNIAGAQWNQISDLLTHHLNGVGYNFSIGYTNDYSWVCGGWGTNTARLSDISRYMGFLKCLYTAGMVGGVAGYFDYPAGGFDASFPTNNPPHWLLQIMALSHAHALFSHLEPFLTNGDLLSGPQCHVWSRDQPAYEFTNTVADANARVLARKLRTANQWIVTAWAADGTNRNVTVNIPTVGNLTVLAADSGSVYRVTQLAGGNMVTQLLDEYGDFSEPAQLTQARVHR